jgi:hypothetical protein
MEAVAPKADEAVPEDEPLDMAEAAKEYKAKRAAAAAAAAAEADAAREDAAEAKAASAAAATKPAAKAPKVLAPPKAKKKGAAPRRNLTTSDFNALFKQAPAAVKTSMTEVRTLTPEIQAILNKFPNQVVPRKVYTQEMANVGGHCTRYAPLHRQRVVDSG